MNLQIAESANGKPKLSRSILWGFCFLLFSGVFLGFFPDPAIAQPDVPVFSVPSGVYATSQTVSITDATPGAKIYYTTNGTAPTAASALYNGPIHVSSNQTFEAIAFQKNTPSALAWATYTFGTGHPTDVLNFSKGFASSVGSVQLNGSSSLKGSQLQLTNGATYQAGSAFYATPVTIDQPFTTNFTFRLSPPDSVVPLSNMADGITFTLISAEPYIVSAGSSALGSNGSALGFAGIANNAEGGYRDFDMALKFDLHNNAGEGPNSTGLYVNGAPPTVPAIDLTGTGINLHSGHSFFAQVTYDGSTNFTLSLTDIETLARWSHTFAVDIPQTIGSVIAFAGFTGGSGMSSAKQDILSWTYVSGSTGAQTVTPSLPSLPDYPAGFNPIGLITNGSASLSGKSLRLTDGGENEAGSAFYALPVGVDQPFSTDFSFRLSPPNQSVPLSRIADGITFAIVNAEPYIVLAGSGALGNDGDALGFAGIGNNAGGGYNNFDLAIKFDLYNNDGEGPDSTGLYINGALPTVPAINLTGTGIDLHSGHAIHAHIAYDGTDLSLTLTDTETKVTFSHAFPIDIPRTIGGVTAYVGFTGGTGLDTAKQDILSWTFSGTAQ